MKKRYAAAAGASRLLDMPLEYTSGLPRVQLDGFSTVRVEAHRGVRVYGEDSVELGGRGAAIRVFGRGLELKRLTAELAVVSGRIKGVEYIYEDEKP